MQLYLGGGSTAEGLRLHVLSPPALRWRDLEQSPAQAVTDVIWNKTRLQRAVRGRRSHRAETPIGVKQMGLECSCPNWAASYGRRSHADPGEDSPGAGTIAVSLQVKTSLIAESSREISQELPF